MQSRVLTLHPRLSGPKQPVCYLTVLRAGGRRRVRRAALRRAFAFCAFSSSWGAACVPRPKPPIALTSAFIIVSPSLTLLPPSSQDPPGDTGPTHRIQGSPHLEFLNTGPSAKPQGPRNTLRVPGIRARAFGAGGHDSAVTRGGRPRRQKTTRRPREFHPQDPALTVVTIQEACPAAEAGFQGPRPEEAPGRLSGWPCTRPGRLGPHKNWDRGRESEGHRET